MVDVLSISHLTKIAYDNKIPFSVMIELLTSCNLKCKHCYIPEHNNYGQDTDTVKKLLYDLREMGTLNISLTGGEIFLRKDIFDIIETARKLHFRVILLSNASLLDEEKIHRLASLYITEFSTTIFSLDSAIHDSITGVTGSLDASLHNITLMKKYNVPVKIKTPLMKDNRFCYKELQEYCSINNFEYDASPIIFSRSNGDNSTHLLRIDENDLVKIVEDIDTMKRKTGKPFLEEYNEPCAALCYAFSIDCKGDVFPCNSLYLKVGNIFDNSVSEIWNCSQLLKEVKQIKKNDLHKCKKCELVNLCERCPGLALLEDGDLLGCSSVAKNIASVRHKILQRKGV